MSTLSRRNVLAMLPAVGLLPAAKTSRNTFAIRDVRVFDGRRVIERGAVLVIGGRIAAVGDCAVPKGIREYDGSGKTVLPGLIDSHVHTYEEARRDALRFGVTTELDMFGDPEPLAEAKRDRRSARRVVRSDLWSAGIGVTVPGGHPQRPDWEFPRLTPRDDPDAFVTARVREGSDYVKLVVESRAHFETLTPEQVRAVVRAAHRHRRLAVAHAEWSGDTVTALDAGADGVVHTMCDQAMGDAFVRRFRGRFLVATLSVYDCGAGADSLLTDERVAPYLSAYQLGTLLERNPRCTGKWLPVGQANVLRLHRAGVTVLAGTDALMPGTASGASMLAELELLVDAGLSPVEALAAGTSRPAAVFGLHDRGSLTPGRKADLVLVHGDPTRDIRALRDFATIWKNGNEVDRTPPTL